MKRKAVPSPKDKKKYPIWVPITVPATKAEMRYYVGRKCRDFDPICPCCTSWLKWEKSGKIRTVVERRAHVLMITEDL